MLIIGIARVHLILWRIGGIVLARLALDGRFFLELHQDFRVGVFVGITIPDPYGMLIEQMDLMVIVNDDWIENRHTSRGIDRAELLFQWPHGKVQSLELRQGFLVQVRMRVAKKPSSCIVTAEINFDALIPLDTTTGKHTATGVNRTILLFFNSRGKNKTVRNADVGPTDDNAKGKQSGFHGVVDIQSCGKFFMHGFGKRFV